MATYYVDSSVGNDGNAGTSAGSGNAWATITHAIGAVAAGDTVYIEAIAGNAATWPTTSLDYSLATYGTPAAGNATAGPVRWIGRNGRPTIGCNGLAFYAANYQVYQGLYLVATGNAVGTEGLLHGSYSVVRDCVLNLTNQATLRGLAIGGAVVVGCTIRGHSSAPSSSATSDLISTTGYGAVIVRNRLYNGRGAGILAPTSGVIANNLIYGCAGDGIVASAVDSTTKLAIFANTIHGNGGHGISGTGTAQAMVLEVHNNLITGHATSGKAGLSLADGSASLNDARIAYLGYDAFDGNDAHRINISAAAGDVDDEDPGYVDAANGDFTPTNEALRGAGLGGVDIGAVRMAAAGGGSTYVFSVEG